MKSIRALLPSGLSAWLLWGATFWLSASAWGQTTLSENSPTVKPTVTVERQGCLLVLSYKLVGTDGQPSAPRVASSRPEFTIHKGNRKIASGQFQYG